MALAWLNGGDPGREEPATRTLRARNLCPSAASKAQHNLKTPGRINGCRCCWDGTERKAAFRREGAAFLCNFCTAAGRRLSCCCYCCFFRPMLTDCLTRFFFSASALHNLFHAFFARKKKNPKKTAERKCCLAKSCTKQHWLPSILPSGSFTSSEQALSGVSPSLFKKHLLCSI